MTDKTGETDWVAFFERMRDADQKWADREYPRRYCPFCQKETNQWRFSGRWWCYSFGASPGCGNLTTSVFGIPEFLHKCGLISESRMWRWIKVAVRRAYGKRAGADA